MLLKAASLHRQKQTRLTRLTLQRLLTRRMLLTLLMLLTAASTEALQQVQMCNNSVITARSAPPAAALVAASLAPWRERSDAKWEEQQLISMCRLALAASVQANL